MPQEAMQTLHICMLGSFTLKVGGKSLTDSMNRSKKLWNVLSYLLYHRDRDISQQELIEQIWMEPGRGNEINALKTLLYRVRMLLKPIFPDGVDPIVSRRGMYAWNRAIPCRMDFERFEEFYHQAARPRLGRARRLDLLRRALDLYQGDFLPKLMDQPWVAKQAAQYRVFYISAVKTLVSMLEEEGAFEEIYARCIRASQIEPLDEELYIYAIRALLHQGRLTPALEYYDQVTELLYRQTGTRPCGELQALYMSIMNTEQRQETDLTTIQDNLKEVSARPGAFVCGYGLFKEIYRLTARQAERSGMLTHIALITVSGQDRGTPALEELNEMMDQLLEVLVHNMRKGDVVARYSGAQYIVMMPGANYKNSVKVIERTISVFNRRHRQRRTKLSYRIRGLEHA